MTDKSVPKIPGDLLEDILQAVSKDLTRGRQRIKNDWIRNARALFDPSERAPCHICGQFQATAEAHHPGPAVRRSNDNDGRRASVRRLFRNPTTGDSP